MVIGTVPWAATASWSVLVGTSHCGGGSDGDSGNGTSFVLKPSNSCGTLPFSRTSAKKSFLMLPVLVIVMVVVTGCPAGSTVLGEFGMPLLLTAGAANETDPVNGSLRCAPSPGPATFSTNVHRPGRGAVWKNCMVGPTPRKLPFASSWIVDCAS